MTPDTARPDGTRLNATPPDTARDVAHRIYAAFNGRDLGAAETIFAADFYSHPLGATGPDAVTRSWSRMIAAYPDIQVVVEDMLVDADSDARSGADAGSGRTRVAVRTSLHGIPGDGDADGGRTPEMVEIFHVQDGRIAELWGLTTFSRPAR